MKFFTAMKQFYLLLGLLSVASLSAQTLIYNNNQSFFVNEDAVVIVKDGDIDNNQGIFENKGSIIVEGSYINNDETIGGQANSEFQITEDWVNNADFSANETTVRMLGNIQSITGIEISTFYNLYLENIGVKSLGIDASVSNILNLNSVQLATGFNKMTVLNSNPQAIEFIEEAGFVSSDGEGRLVRNTNQISEYIFPVGEINNGLKYRPVLIKPSNASTNQYEARLAYTNAGIEGYDLNTQNGSLAEMNDNFFHYINQSEGNTESEIQIAFKPAEDGNWNEIGKWEENWSAIRNVSVGSGNLFSFATKSSWISNGDEPHVLANTKEGPMYAIPNVFAPNGAQEANQTFGVLNQNGMVSLKQLQVFDRWGTKVFDSQIQNTESWDGWYDGTLQASGSYAYLIYLQDLDGNDLEAISGNVLLIW